MEVQPKDGHEKEALGMAGQGDMWQLEEMTAAVEYTERSDMMLRHFDSQT